jgi:hypothetical protein
MINYLKNALIISIILGIVYIILNIFVFIWDIIGAEGFLGYFYFSAVFVIGFTTLTAVLAVIYFFILKVINNKEVRGTSGWTILGIFVFALIAGAFRFGPTLLITDGLNERYKYISNSDDYFDQGKYSEALVEAQNIYDKVIYKRDGSNYFWFIKYWYYHTDFASEGLNNDIYQTTINLAYCYQAEGENLKLADSLFNVALRMARTNFQSYLEYEIVPLNGLLLLSEAKDDFIKSEEYLQRLIKLQDKFDENDIISSITKMWYYSISLENRGLHKKATDLKIDILNLYEKSELSKESEIYFSLIINITNNFIAQNNIALARKELKKAEEISDNFDNTPSYEFYLLSNAKFYERLEDFNKAEEYYLEAIDFIADHEGEMHYNYAYYNAIVAFFYLKNARIKKAQYHMNQSNKWVANNNDRFNVFNSINIINSIFETYQGNTDDSFISIQLLRSDLFDNINNRFLFYTEDEREAHIQSLDNIFNIINYVIINSKRNDISEELYFNVLSTKSIAMLSNIHTRKFIKKSNRSSLINQYDLISKSKNELEIKEYSGMINQIRLNEIRDSIRQVEMKLITEIVKIPGYDNFKINQFNWGDVRSALKDGEVCIEYIKIAKTLNSFDNPTYYALKIDKNATKPDLIELVNEDSLKNLISSTKSNRQKIDSIYSGENLSLIKKILWEKLQINSDSIYRVYISPTGLLHGFSFAAITIDEIPEIVLLNSSRSIINNEEIDDRSKQTVLFGDIDYSGFNKQNDTTIGVSTYRSRTYEDLPGTKTEVLSVDTILTENGFHSNVYTKAKASEREFKNLSDSIIIVHIATHGFFYSFDQSYKVDEMIGNPISSSHYTNPLFRSGLILAKDIDNNGLKYEDGMLFSYEISKQDLSSVDLIVLSACETGLGDIVGIQGVYGLQRAFKLAGANSIIMSLWKIPDKETSELMVNFYNYYIGDQRSKQEALKMAQLDLRKKCPEPFYWAGFTIIE